MEYRVIRNDDSLMHAKGFKYIKKVKGKNGKYRYIYDVKDALGYDERDRYRKAEAAADKARQKFDHMKAVKDAVAEDAWYKWRNHPTYADEGAQGTGIARTEQMVDDVNKKLWGKTYDAMVTSRHLADTAQKDYAKTPLYKLERASGKGKKFLNKLFNIN